MQQRARNAGVRVRSCEVIPATRDGVLEDGTTCERIDLADLDDLHSALDRIAPDLIVNAAAYTAVDRAEDESALAMRVNGDAVGAIGTWAAAHGARVVHYSTDYVFDGRATRPYREDDPTHPLGVYGSTKLAGEVALRDSGARHLILRTAWVYGARGHNFLRTMLRLGAERDELRVVDDQVGAPTSAALIAEVTAEVIARWLAADDAASRRRDGTYHIVASGSTSWCGFARAIFERAAPVNASGTEGKAIPVGRASRAFASLRPSQAEEEEMRASQAKGEETRVDSRSSTPFQGKRVTRQRGEMPTGAPRITAIATADYPTKAARPAYSVLDTAKLRETFDIGLPDWQTVLDGVMDELVGHRS
ncbi:MAG: dTDP-4-dehydrorhamnose reductase [Rhodanobacteraceae bacterium]